MIIDLLIEYKEIYIISSVFIGVYLRIERASKYDEIADKIIDFIIYFVIWPFMLFNGTMNTIKTVFKRIVR